MHSPHRDRGPPDIKTAERKKSDSIKAPSTYFPSPERGILFYRPVAASFFCLSFSHFLPPAADPISLIITQQLNLYIFAPV